MAALIDRGRSDIKLNGYGTASAAALADRACPRVQDYRRQASTRTVAPGLRDIPSAFPPRPTTSAARSTANSPSWSIATGRP